MRLSLIIILFFSSLFLISCSASYEKLSKNTFIPPNEFSKHLLKAYKSKADFEAIEMHDWNSAKLYSEKALSAIEGEKILPQTISYWKIEPIKRVDLIKAYNNLMTIYNDALTQDPYNLAKAISSLDCWSEQQEENWQTWDINKCRDDFLNAMHIIYGLLDEKKQVSSKSKLTSNISENLNESDDNVSIVTQDINQNILQIIYFDFDKSNLTEVSLNEIKNFININKETINKFIIIGHTDTMGTKEYNMKLSLERAETVKNILLDLGIQNQNIKILGKGENDMKVQTNDEVAHPANRRAEISPLN
jgi:OOP family OmpA-OmpF porin